MMMTMRASDVLPPPRPSYLASCGLSLASGVALPPPLEEPELDYPMLTEDDEYQALMLAEFGPLVSLPLTQDEMMPADDDAEIQAPALQPKEEEPRAAIADENEMKARPDNKKRRKKRKKPPPSAEDDMDEIEELPSPPSAEDDIDEIEEVPSPPTTSTSKMMATRLLKRQRRTPEPWEPEGRTVLCCQCAELPLDSPACALHQAAPFRSWMLDQDQIPAIGSDDGVVVPKRPTDSKRTVLKYIRWRRRVWMPSRFYVEHAQSMEMALLSTEA